MVDFIKELYQTEEIRDDSKKRQTSVTLSDNAIAIFKGIKRNLSERCPGLEITRSLVFETFIHICKSIIVEKKIEKTFGEKYVEKLEAKE